MTGKLKVTGLEEKRRFRCCLEGHLDAAGVRHNQTARQILAELGKTRTAAEVAMEVNEIIAPFETNPQTVRILMDNLNIEYKASEPGRPWGGGE